ncbi:MAG: efflux RND transporter periplasmic adaptor subunit [Ferruginibacter sp.]
MKRIKIISVVSIIIFAYSCTSKQPTEKISVGINKETTVQLNVQQQKNASIEKGNITDKEVSETITLSGLVDVPPQNIVSVSFPLGGYLKSTKLLPGMHVYKGETIAVIEDQSLVQLQQDYLMAKAKQSLAKLEYERQKSLNETKTAADKIFQQAEAEYQNARILVLGLAEKLRLININPEKMSADKITRMISVPSPINGFVSKVNVNIGKYVQPQDVLFELINPSDIHAALTVFEKDINKIQPGQKVQINFIDAPEKIYDAAVLLITKNVDENRSGIVHCHFENMPPDLKPGMFINAIVKINNSVVKALPEEAVVRYENKEFVFVERNKDQFEAVAVKTGKKYDGWIEILPDSNLTVNQVFVVKNAFAVLSALKNVAED